MNAAPQPGFHRAGLASAGCAWPGAAPILPSIAGVHAPVFVLLPLAEHERLSSAWRLPAP
jgi:hypothetical protein